MLCFWRLDNFIMKWLLYYIQNKGCNGTDTRSSGDDDSPAVSLNSGICYSQDECDNMQVISSFTTLLSSNCFWLLRDVIFSGKVGPLAIALQDSASVAKVNSIAQRSAWTLLYFELTDKSFSFWWQLLAQKETRGPKLWLHTSRIPITHHLPNPQPSHLWLSFPTTLTFVK